MRDDLRKLTIFESELEDFSGIDIGHPFFTFAYRRDRLQNSQNLGSFLLAQLFVLIAIFVLLTPMGIVAVRNLGFSGEDPNSLLYFLGLTLGVALGIQAIANVFLYRRMQKYETFLNLAESIEQHNKIVRSADILDRIEAAGNTGICLDDRAEAMAALNIARQSLIASLKTERILREHQDTIDRRYELFANLEDNLSTLRDIAIREEASEYGRLLNQALKVGASVDKELRKLQQQNCP